MEFIVNERSIHEQFHSSAAFVESFERILALRTAIERSRRTVRCSREVLDAKINSDVTVRQALASLNRNLRTVATMWLAKNGPFWDDEPLHRDDDWFEDDTGTIVTKTGMGEAAMAALRHLPRALLTFDPSNSLRTPLVVQHVQNDGQSQSFDLQNHWDLPPLEQCLRGLRPPLASWENLVQWANDECPHITLTGDVIQSLDGHPFVPGAAERFQELLKVLDTMQSNVGPDDHLQSRGMELFQNHFVGGKNKKVWFSDSSDGEKSTFRQELSFPDPEQPGTTMSCTWHGKVKINQMRVHFTFPFRHDHPLYVVYIGPKLTKR
jgi:hypothetical protein